MKTDKEKSLTYKEAGVDIEAGNEAVRLLAPMAQSTFDSRVLNDIGAFSGLYSLGSLGFSDPVLVSSTDGVGTKLKVAIMADRHDTVGIDLVAMSVNDVLTQGARPLFFLDYLAMGRIEPAKVASLVSGVAHGCRLAGCALLGGETAEMPGFYQGQDYDMAGFAVGLVERASIIDGSDIALGHRLIGLPSSGLHSNGYSLARRIVFGELGLAIDSPLLGSTVADVLLAPTRIYASSVLAVLKRHPISGLVHVTGGGLLENVPRVLPLGCQATIFLGSWARPPIFDFLAQAASLGTGELYRTFNMGLGLVLVVAPREVDGIMGILQDHGENPALIGEIAGQAGQERVVLVDGVYQPGGTAL
ncbi:MAG: phosphoribosylformylglycinamidine cyclo-ligase [Deltaproteobacteria bacterium]|nr:phosphoribosylformylglycinamidine cyclo-ligase [Deltaproteobacteria bacterium]